MTNISECRSIFVQAKAIRLLLNCENMKTKNLLISEVLVNYLKIDGFMFTYDNKKVLSKNDNSFVITELGLYHPSKGILTSLLDLKEILN